MKNKITIRLAVPFLVLFSLTILNKSAGSQTWTALGSGTNNDIRAIVFYNGTLIVGGLFNIAGGQNISHIAMWNGSNWSSIGLGVNGNVYALTVYNNLLIAAGSFTTAGGLSANRIASWDGNSWSPLASGFNNDVYALVVSSNLLYAGGAFTSSGPVVLSRIAMWNGSWNALHGGTNNNVNALASYNSILFAGGTFTLAGGTSVNKIASWDGTNWSALGLGMDDGQVNTLTLGEGYLFVGGTFTSIGGVPVNRIARWTGSNWLATGIGFDAGVNAVGPFLGGAPVFAGGDFTTADGNSASKAAVWNGSSWSPMGTGITGTNATVSAVCYDDNSGTIIFGGHFTNAGGVTVSNIAGWSFPVGIINASTGIPSQYVLRQNYPNPFNPSTKIRFGIPKNGFVKLAVYNSVGKEVRVLVNEFVNAGNYEIPFNALNLSSGIYFYKLIAGNYSETKKLVLIK